MTAGYDDVAADRLDDLLVKTSRTFAISIPELPEPTRREVTVAYLLFRIADTLEDATDWQPARKIVELEAFASLLRREAGPDARALASRWLEPPPLADAAYVELLSSLPAVTRAFERLSPAAREKVREHTLRTVERMAAFVGRATEGAGLELADVVELRDYCYAVAGIVGEMLTELMLLGCPALAPAAPKLRATAARFGEALQLVNILKDSSSDAREGRRYLPRGVDPRQVLALARGDLDDAAAYVLELQRRGAPRGMVAFTALPVLLARGTLDLVERRGAGAKLSREDVRRIGTELDRRLARGAPAVS